MANGESSSVFGGGFVQKACQPAKPTPGCDCRLCSRSRVLKRSAARCGCGRTDGLVLVEVFTCGEAPVLERYTFQWMCPACRQLGCPF